MMTFVYLVYLVVGVCVVVLVGAALDCMEGDDTPVSELGLRRMKRKIERSVDN